MSDVRDATETLLDDRPTLEEDLEAVLEVDAEHATWTFDDVPLDSGTFGELVSRGVVAKTDGEYELADRDAVRAVLSGEASTDEAAAGTDRGVEVPSLSELAARVDWVVVASLVGVLAFVVLMRTAFSWGAVFRNGDVVLLGNDPYFYRYWVEELVRTDPGLGEMPAALKAHDVLMIAVVWGAASLLGGTEHAVGVVLTWYPVVAAALVGVLVYATAVVAFDDRRVGLASVAVYAVTPIVAYRSALGFGDHHAFDYLLVALTVYGLVCLVDERADWRTATGRPAVGVAALAVGVAGQVHAWRGGPLLLAPIAVAVVGLAASDVRAGRSPLRSNAPLAGALGVAAVLAMLPHLLLDWSGLYRAVSPALLFAGTVATLAAGEGARRAGYGGRAVLALEGGGGLAVGAAAWVALPAVRNAVLRGLGYFGRTGQTSISETYSLLSPEYGVIATPFFYFGVAFFVGFAGLAWTTWRVVDAHRPRWLALAAYAWTFFAASVVQLRFAAQLAIPLSAFAGLAFVYLVAAVDATDLPRPFVVANDAGPTTGRESDDDGDAGFSLPDRQTAFAVGSLFLLVGGFGLVLTPGGTSQLTVSGDTYAAATAIDDHAAAANATWPENYVFSDWGDNRIYNYFVNGHSRSYLYAQEHYESFVKSTNPGEWYERLADKPTGYVVVQPADGQPAPDMMQSRLWDNWGSANGSIAGLGHYRAVYANDDRKVYEVVPGATLVGAAPPNSSVTVSNRVSVPGASFTYERRATASPGGAATVTVPYGGEYAVGNSTLTVSDAAVHSGGYAVADRLKSAGAPGEVARWTFDARLDEVVIDRVGDSHAEIRGDPQYRSGVSGTAVAFDGENDTLRVPAERAPEVGNGSFTVTFWIRGNLSEASARYPAVLADQNDGGYGVWARNNVGDFGVRIDDTDGDSVRNFGIETTRFESWTHVAVVLDRDAGELRLYRNGTLVQTSPAGSLDTVANDAPLFLGSRGGVRYAPVQLDGVRVYERALDETALGEQLNQSR